MWPKMLIELLPHLTRLVPAWDRFLQTRAATEKANQSAMEAMVTSADGVRSDLAQVTAAHGALYRQIQDQNAQIATLGEQVRLAREAAEVAAAAAKAGLGRPGIEALAGWIKGGVVAIILLLVVVIVLQLAHHAV